MSIEQAIARAVTITARVIEVALLLLVLAALAQRFGIRVPSLPVTSVSDLGWLCLAFAALRFRGM